MDMTNEFSDNIKQHPFYIKNIDEINKLGINGFLKYNGIFVKVLPLMEYPIQNGKEVYKIKSIRYEIEYWTTIKDENHWNMGYYESENMDEKEINDSAILKGFEFINSRLKGEFK